MRSYIYALGAILCWASLPAAIGSGLSCLSTEELLFYSFTSAAIYLYLQDLCISRSFKIYLPGIKSTMLGIWGIFGYHYLYYKAMDNAPLAEGAILATTWSFWIVVFSSLITYRRLKISILLTAMAGMAGAGLVISSGKALSFDASCGKGYMFAVCCGLVWGSFSVGLPHLESKRSPMTAYTIYAAVLSAFLFAVTSPHSFPGLPALSSAVYVGTVPLGLSFYLWNKAVTGGNLSIIGFLSYLTPPLAVLLVALIHRQHVSGQVILGMGIILTASLTGKLIMDANKNSLIKNKREKELQWQNQ